MAVKGLERVQKCQGCRIPDPLYGLPVGNYPHVVHRDDGIEKRYEALLVMRLSEPCGVVEQTERCPVFREIKYIHLFHIWSTKLGFNLRIFRVILFLRVSFARRHFTIYRSRSRIQSCTTTTTTLLTCWSCNASRNS